LIVILQTIKFISTCDEKQRAASVPYIKKIIADTMMARVRATQLRVKNRSKPCLLPDTNVSLMILVEPYFRVS